jgi:hypothetical protein
MYSSGNNSNIHGRRPMSSDVNVRSEQTESILNIPSWDLNGPLKCSYDNCDRLYWDEETLKRHEAHEHPIPLLCPFSLECQQSRKKYFGHWNLRKHVELKHTPVLSELMCFDPKCKYDKTFKSWYYVLSHIFKEHLEAVGIIVQSITTQHNIFKKCSYENCNQPFKTGNAFLHHLVTSHPYPLRCPYNSKCHKFARDGEGHLGLIELEQHITTQHSAQFPEPMCFNRKCQQKEHFTNWTKLMKHILEKHWGDIRLN